MLDIFFGSLSEIGSRSVGSATHIEKSFCQNTALSSASV